MNKRWHAWLAGLIDGEGTISITRHNANKYGHPYLGPLLQIANTDTRLLKRAAEIIEHLTGKPSHKFVVTNPRDDLTRRKLGYRLAVHTQWELLLVLPAIRPYLVGKVEQADTVIDFCRRRCGRAHQRWREFVAEDYAGYIRCLELNRRGPKSDAALVAATEELERMLHVEEEH